MDLLAEVTNLLASLSDDSPDSWAGLMASAVAGAAAAIAVTILLTLYFRSGYRTSRDIARHAVAALMAFGLLAFAAYDMRRAAFDYLGINASKPAVEFEIRLPTAVASTALTSDTQIELHTNRNQTLAKVDDALSPMQDGRSVLHGSVPLRFRTADRTVILSLPGQAQRRFKLRLAANPNSSDTFGPWHLADGVVSLHANESTSTISNDAYAIRYRVM